MNIMFHQSKCVSALKNIFNYSLKVLKKLIIILYFNRNVSKTYKIFITFIALYIAMPLKESISINYFQQLYIYFDFQIYLLYTKSKFRCNIEVFKILEKHDFIQSYFKHFYNCVILLYVNKCKHIINFNYRLIITPFYAYC